MAKLVSIIIPFHRETEAQLMVVLSSINNQIGIDFDQVEVILVNDGGQEIDTTHFLPLFTHLQIRYHRYSTAKGPGFARGVGTAMAQGRYVMYMDADDQFQFVGALLEFFNVIRGHGDHEVIIAAYLEETYHNGEYRYFRHENNDWKAAYAKWFNQDYLKRIGLTWREDLHVFEDTYFVGIACELAQDIYHLNSVVYTWQYQASSTVRVNGGQSFYRQLDQWARSNRYYLTMIQRYRPARLNAVYLHYIADLYLRLQAYPPLDPAAFAHEHQQLMQTFAPLWALLQAQVPAEIKRLSTTKPAFAKVSMTGIAAFMRHQAQLAQP